jgi:hypothetical protein
LKLEPWPRQLQAIRTRATELLFGGASEGGKAELLDSVVATPDGYSTIGQLKVGDSVFSEVGEPIRVSYLHPVKLCDAYEFTFSDGSKVITSREHLWHTYTFAERTNFLRLSPEFRIKRRWSRPSRALLNPEKPGVQRSITKRNKCRIYQYKALPKGDIRTSQEIYETLRTPDDKHSNHAVLCSKPLNLPLAFLPLHPYVLGAWLGDGTSSAGAITSADSEVLDRIRPHFGVSKRNADYQYGILGLLPKLRELGVLNNKHIPVAYLRASESQRLDLLKGLMDTDGTVNKNGSVTFDNTNKQLIDGVYDLIVGLGWRARITHKIPTLRGKECKICYRLKWTPSRHVFYLGRKRSLQRIRRTRRCDFRYIVNCEYAGLHKMRCITVENPTGLYLTSKSMIPTHNSFFIRIALILWCSCVHNLQCFVFRKYYGDVISNHWDGPQGFRVLLEPWVSQKLVRITENSVTFKATGAQITGHGLLYDSDLEKHQGREKHVLVIDEATQIIARYIHGLRAWVRMPAEMKELLPEQLKALYPHIPPEERRELFPRIIYTANPIGASVGYFRREFVDIRPPFKIEKVGAFFRQYIPSRIEDNPSADMAAQAERLKYLGEATARALRLGSWNEPVGDFFPEYNDEIHTVEEFTVPEHWFKYRTFDWGSSEPFCAHWWAVSDGERFKDDVGQDRWFPESALVCYREWYGCNPEDPAKGLGLRNEDIARGIVERTYEKMSGATLSDNYPFADRGHSRNGVKYTMADTFFENSCPLTLGNTSRVYGWKQLRTRLQGKDGFPMLYIFKSCKYLRDYLPALPYHETKQEDAAEHGEATHACDSARLAAAARPWTTYREEPQVKKPVTGNPLSSMSPKMILQKFQKSALQYATRR